MAQVTITIPNDKLAEVADALAWVSGYQEQVVDPQTGQMVANPVTKNQNAKLAVIKYVKNARKEYLNMLATTAAQEDIDIT